MAITDAGLRPVVPIAGATSSPNPVRRRTSRAVGWWGVVGVGLLTLWLALIGVLYLLDSHALPTTLAAAQWRTAGPVLFAVVAALVVAERWWPAERRPLLVRAHLVDAGYLVLFAVAVVPVLTIVETGFAVEAIRHARFLLLSRLPIAPEVVTVALTLVAIDAMNWAAHVANHRYASFWRLHALHHSQEEMSVFTTFRTHPLVHSTYLGALLPALVLGASGVVPGVALVVYGCLVTVPHANLRWTYGPLGRILVSPAYHRLHHASSPPDSRGTVNFGFVLVCWDQMARRALLPIGGRPVATGLAGRPVPVEQADLSVHGRRIMVRQLAQPFHMHGEMGERP